MYYAFTEDARNVFVAANRQAKELKHDFIGSGHILLAMLAESSAVVSILWDARIDPEAVRYLATMLLSESPTSDVDTGRKVTAAAMQDARQLEHGVVDTPHILLGMLDTKDCLAARVFDSLCTSTKRLRQAAERRLADVPKAVPLPPWEAYKDDPRIKPLVERFNRLDQMKWSAVAGQKFEEAARLRDQADGVRREIHAALKSMEQNDAADGPSE